MDVESKIALVKKVPMEEIVTEAELRELFETKTHPIAYDGFEPSGIAHIASGLMRAQKINDLVKADIKFKALAADWHGWLNNKLGGDLERLQKAGDYLIKVWETLGVNPKKVDMVRSNDLVDQKEYWEKVVKISKETTVARMTRCLEIMGRKEGELKYAAQYLYPAMQAADIYQLEADITQLGMDQRKVNMLARDIGPKLGWWKPVVASHHMLMGLQGPAKMAMDQKMSKSKPETAIYVHDSVMDIEKKLNKAYCPEKDPVNGVMEICEYIIFRGDEIEFTIERPDKFGGTITYHTYAELEADYVKGVLHPSDLKKKVAAEVAALLKPCREYFEKHPKYLEVFDAGITR